MVKIYTGDNTEVAASATAVAIAANSKDAVDTAFITVAKRAIDAAPASVRQCPSTAPSPILRWLLLQQQQQQHHQSEPSTSTKSAFTVSVDDANAGLSSSGVNNISNSGTSSAPAPAPSSGLAKRGVGLKDPLLQRLEKKRKLQQQSQQQQQQQHVIGSSTSTSSATTTVSTTTGMTQKQWTERPLSEMTSASWAVFRNRLGIEVQIVSRRFSSSSISAAGFTAPAAFSLPSSTVKTFSHHSQRKLQDKAQRGSSGSGIPSASHTGLATLTADSIPPIRCWEEAKLPYALGKSVASRYTLPTAVQCQCVPLAMTTTTTTATTVPSSPPSSRIDVLGVAETGSGKTAAYLIPLLADIRMHRPRLLDDPELIALGPYALVMVPTRELAEQVTREVNALLMRSNDNSAVDRERLVRWEAEEEKVEEEEQQQRQQQQDGDTESKATMMKPAHRMGNPLSEIQVVKVVGGESSQSQYETLSRGAHIVVGTIGQLQSLLEDRLLSLGNTATVVIDEADRMIEENQREALVSVLNYCPPQRERQTLLFTATLSAACAALAKAYLSREGYWIVRTPHRCAAIRQNFEVFSADVNAADGGGDSKNRKAEAQSNEEGSGITKVGRNQTHKSSSDPAGGSSDALRERVLSPAVHPQKFNRLVTWLAYTTGDGPIIVFANERRTCDALQEELRLEAAHLSCLSGSFSLESLVGEAPAGLFFEEDNRPSSSLSAQSKAGSSSSSTPSTVNLTSVAVVHSELSQAERRRLIDAFQRGHRRVLITTDLLSRGLDIANVRLVINYDMPWPAPQAGSSEDASSAVANANTTDEDAVARYVHRIGRTGRAGATGVTTSFVTLSPGVLTRASAVAAERMNGGCRGGAGKRNVSEGAAGGTSRDLNKRHGDDVDEDSMIRIYAPGTSEAVKQRDTELAELTRGASNRGLGISEEFLLAASNHARGAMNDGGEAGSRDDGRDQRRRRRSDDDDDYVEEGDMGSSGDADAEDSALQQRRRQQRRIEKVANTFGDDESIIKPLWKFLTQTASGNGYTDGASVLSKHAYSKICLPEVLLVVMQEISRQSQYGTIVN